MNTYINSRKEFFIKFPLWDIVFFVFFLQCQILVLNSRENPQAVLLQEVTPVTLPILQQNCTGYRVISGGSTEYFTAIMLKDGQVVFKGKEIQPFENTVMMRNLLSVQVQLDERERERENNCSGLWKLSTELKFQSIKIN